MANAAWLALTVMAHTLAAPWGRLEPTSRTPPRTPCGDASSPFPDGWSPADDADIAVIVVLILVL